MWFCVLPCLRDVCVCFRVPFLCVLTTVAVEVVPAVPSNDEEVVAFAFFIIRL